MKPRNEWSIYSWTLNGVTLIIPAPDRASDRVAALAVLDERFKLGILTDRLWTAWTTRVKSFEPERGSEPRKAVRMRVA